MAIRNVELGTVLCTAISFAVRKVYCYNNAEIWRLEKILAATVREGAGDLAGAGRRGVYTVCRRFI